MSIVTIIAVFFVVWWVTFVALANMGVKTQAEAGEIIPGTPAGAPHKTRIGRNALWTTLVSAIIVAIIYWLITYSGLTLADYPFMPKFIDYK